MYKCHGGDHTSKVITVFKNHWSGFNLQMLRGTHCKCTDRLFATSQKITRVEKKKPQTLGTLQSHFFPQLLQWKPPCHVLCGIILSRLQTSKTIGLSIRWSRSRQRCRRRVGHLRSARLGKEEQEAAECAPVPFERSKRYYCFEEKLIRLQPANA